VTGGAISGFDGSCEHDIFGAVAVSAGFVARFTESGAPDPSFGDDGLVGGRGLSENALGAETIGDPLVSPSGTITFRSVSASICERNLSHLGVAQLTPDGRSRLAFGKDGAIVGRFKALAPGPHGSVFALAEEPRHEKDPVRARVLRFAPDGALDRSFGRGGQATVHLGPSYGTTLDSLAVDGRSRVLVGGTLETQAGRAMVLLRVSAGGEWERNFGPHGRVASKLPQLAQFGASDIFFDPQGRLVAVHQSMEERTGDDDLLVARYLLRN
jgi:hypothetical protein